MIDVSTKKEHALAKILGGYGVDISDKNASCGECNKTYTGGELKEVEEEITNEFYTYRLTYKCPNGHVVFGADV